MEMSGGWEEAGGNLCHRPHMVLGPAFPSPGALHPTIAHVLFPFRAVFYSPFPAGGGEVWSVVTAGCPWLCHIFLFLLKKQPQIQPALLFSTPTKTHVPHGLGALSSPSADPKYFPIHQKTKISFWVYNSEMGEEVSRSCVGVTRYPQQDWGVNEAQKGFRNITKP